MDEFKNEVIEVKLQIKRIKQISFFVNEEMHKNVPAISNVSLAYKIEYNLEKQFLNFVLKVSFIFPNEEKPYIESEVQNVFEIKDLNRFFENGQPVSLPPELLISMVSESLSHARAIISTSSAGTVYTDTLLPLVDGKKVAVQFFGDALKIK